MIYASAKQYNAHNERIAGGRPLADYYDYLFDDDDDPDKQFTLPITHLVHFTENTYARNISDDANSFCFKPNNWKPSFDTEFRYLSWWFPNPPENWGDDIRKHKNFDEYYECYFGKSPVLDGDSFYGPIGLVVSWKDILDQYAISRKKDRADIQLKLFGTFFYTREIMFAILVCMKGDKINGHGFQLIENETKAFRGAATDEIFIWKCYTTTNGWNSNSRKENPACDTWDHLSFAFYFPEENDRLRIPPNLCKIKTKSAINMRIGKDGYRTPNEKNADDDLVLELKRKIGPDA